MHIPALAYAGIFILGLIFGSFFNVAIHRWPQEDAKLREWVRTPSRCPKCMSRIRPYDNIPLVSWLLLGGKCRDCKAPISWRYPAVELGTALLWCATAWLTTTHGLSRILPEQIGVVHVVFAITFASLALLTIIIDFETSLLPEEISIPNFIAAAAFLFVAAPHTISAGWLDSLIGMVALGVPFFIFCWLGWMGLGDVLYVAGVGVLLGWKLTLTAGMIAIGIGGCVALVIMLTLIALRKYKRGIPIPFGPYLAVGTLAAMFYGDKLLAWYLHLIIPASTTLN